MNCGLRCTIPVSALTRSLAGAILGKPDEAHGDVHSRLERVLHHQPGIEGLVARAGLEDDATTGIVEEPIHIVGVMQRKESLAKRDPGHRSGATAASDRQLLADIAERLRDELLRLRVEHASADGGDRTARFGLAAPVQQRRAVAGVDDGRRRRSDRRRCPNPPPEIFMFDAALRRRRAAART